MIGEKIKNRRIELGYSQDKLATLTGYDNRATISKIESGAIDLNVSKVKIFAKALHVSPAYLMGWEEENPEHNKLERLEDEFPEGISILYRANEKLADKEKKQMLKMINSVFFEDGEPEGDDLSNL